MKYLCRGSCNGRCSDRRARRCAGDLAQWHIYLGTYLAANKCISETACEILCMRFDIDCLCLCRALEALNVSNNIVSGMIQLLN